MAHFFDTEIILNMQNFWPEEFQKTSGSRLRSPTDIQYALAYYYFMISERDEFDFDLLFRTVLDHNRDGYDSFYGMRALFLAAVGSYNVSDCCSVLDWNELRNLLMTLNEGPMEQSRM